MRIDEVMTELKDFRKEIVTLLDKKVDKEVCREKHKDDDKLETEIYTNIPQKLGAVYKTIYGLVFGTGGLLIIILATLKFLKIL